MNEWIKTSERPLPRDKTRIMRWHVIYKCIVTVFYNPSFNNECPWITGTLSQSWPEKAFTPHWMPLLKPPKDNS